jgi:hypothetical protein
MSLIRLDLCASVWILEYYFPILAARQEIAASAVVPHNMDSPLVRLQGPHSSRKHAPYARRGPRSIPTPIIEIPWGEVLDSRLSSASVPI